MNHPTTTIIDQIIKHFTVNENEIRNRWNEGSLCEIYNPHGKKWCPVMITRVYTNEKGEWFELRGKLGRAHMQRFDKHTRPLMHTTAKDNANQIAEMKQRYELKQGSFCEVYRSQEQKWYTAMIKRVFMDDRGECVNVLYGKRWYRNINRFDSALRLPRTNEIKDEEESTLQLFSLDENNSKANLTEYCDSTIF
eukprot:535874_1